MYLNVLFSPGVRSRVVKIIIKEAV